MARRATGPPDLTPRVKKLVNTAQHIDQLLAEGREFHRLHSALPARLDADLERVMGTCRDLRAELGGAV